MDGNFDFCSFFFSLPSFLPRDTQSIVGIMHLKSPWIDEHVWMPLIAKAQTHLSAC